MDNYSIVCKRCGRKLKSEESRRRGYGSYCYRKVTKDKNREAEKSSKENIEEIKPIDGQMDIEDILYEVS